MLKINFNITLFFILSLIILPFLLKYLFGVTSLSSSIMIFSVACIIFLIKLFKKIIHVNIYYFILIFFFIFHLLLTIFFNHTLNDKFFTSILGLFIFFTSSYISSLYFYKTESVVSFNAFKYSFVILLLLGLYHMIFIGGARDVFPFAEASHYALFFGPLSLLIYILTTNKFLRISILIFLMMFSFLFPNTTILIYLFLIMFLHLRFNIKSVIFFILIFILISNNAYVSDRIFFLSEESSHNLSSLVYLQGIQDAYNSLIQTYGLGLGFQQMGTQDSSEAGLLIQQLINNDVGLNRQDGGFTAAKIIAEFGVLGLFLLLVYFMKFKKAFNYLRKNLFYKRENNIKEIIANVFIYAYFIELFIRGVGYFSQGTFFFLVALFYLSLKKRNEIINYSQ